MCGGGEGRRWWEWTRSTGSHCSASAEGSRMAPSGTCLSQVGNGLARWGIASWLGGPCCDPWEESGKVNQNLLQYRGVAHRHTGAVAKANKLTHAKPWAPRPCLINGPLLLLVTSLFPLSLFSSPVPAGTLLHRDKQPHLSEDGTERGSGKSSQVPRPPSKTAQSQLGIPALLAPGHCQPLSPRPLVPAGSRWVSLYQGLHRAPWPVPFPYGEMEARAGRVAVPRPLSPRRTTYGVNTGPL